jgi:ADP-ribose pyrophosphatase YjhB (NUDIX family)
VVNQQVGDIGSAEHSHSIPKKRTAAAVLFTDGQNRVLLVEPTYKDVWEMPGGAVEVNESPRDAASREVKEELGLVAIPGRLLAVDWVPPVEGRSEGLAYVFSGGRLSNSQTRSITLAADELRSWAWCAAAEIEQRMRPIVARRVLAARAAADSGNTAELENGHPVKTDPTG